jgi:hypothetical protein
VSWRSLSLARSGTKVATLAAWNASLTSDGPNSLPGSTASESPTSGR